MCCFSHSALHLKVWQTFITDVPRWTAAVNPEVAASRLEFDVKALIGCYGLYGNEKEGNESSRELLSSQSLNVILLEQCHTCHNKN